MSLVIETTSGRIPVPDDGLLVFVDETGVENLSDPNAAYFGFGACLCRASDYHVSVDRPWRELELLFEGHPMPLHAADIVPNDLTATQFEKLVQFFSNDCIGRCASIATAKTVFEVEAPVFHLVAVSLLDLILQVQKEMGANFSEIAFVFEHCARLDRLYADYFRRYKFKRQNGELVPTHYVSQAKSSSDHYMRGLCMADFTAHTAGAMSRSKSKKRKDFTSIFGHELSRHVFIDAVRKKK